MAMYQVFQSKHLFNGFYSSCVPFRISLTDPQRFEIQSRQSKRIITNKLVKVIVDKRPIKNDRRSNEYRLFFLRYFDNPVAKLYHCFFNWNAMMFEVID